MPVAWETDDRAYILYTIQDLCWPGSSNSGCVGKQAVSAADSIRLLLATLLLFVFLLFMQLIIFLLLRLLPLFISSSCCNFSSSSGFYLSSLSSFYFILLIYSYFITSSSYVSSFLLFILLLLFLLLFICSTSHPLASSPLLPYASTSPPPSPNPVSTHLLYFPLLLLLLLVPILSFHFPTLLILYFCLLFSPSCCSFYPSYQVPFLLIHSSLPATLFLLFVSIVLLSHLSLTPLCLSALFLALYICFCPIRYHLYCARLSGCAIYK